MNKIMKIISTVLICFLALFTVLYFVELNKENIVDSNKKDLTPTISDIKADSTLDDFSQIKKFSNYQSLKNFLAKNMGASSSNSRAISNFGSTLSSFESSGGAPMAADTSSKSAVPSSNSYSQTNVQVEGVDEPDIMKNDGKYIYTISGKNLIILDAFPAENMKIIGEIKNITGIRNIFINKNKLIVFGESYSYNSDSISCLFNDYCNSYKSFQFVNIYDISDKSNPTLIKNITSSDNYFDSRMIGNYVYLITTKYIDSIEPELPIFSINGMEKETLLDDLYYFGEIDNQYQFTSISTINLEDDEFKTKSYLLGYTSQLYVSENNIYLLSTEYRNYQMFQEQIIKDVVLPLLPGDVTQKIEGHLDSDIGYRKFSKIGKIVDEYYNLLDDEEKQNFNTTLSKRIYDYKLKTNKEFTKTIIHKIKIDLGDTNYMGTNKVPGSLMDQFSMDETGGYFRIATTSGQTWWGWINGQRINSTNNVYILDENLNLKGSLEDLASGESIRSSRFMGDRLYLVTYRQIDPFFVIDLSNENKPVVLGYLKIPGFSEYLHPYDQNHIIGFGNDANEQGNIKGLKISLFDVTDVNNPIESSKFIIGESGTSSPVLYDHKTLLFSKEKKLLVIPVLEYGLINNDRYNYPRQIWQGAYVLSIDKDDISFRGKITHFDQANIKNYHGWAFYDYRFQIQRSLFMDDYLYTISQSTVKANNINTLDQIKTIDLGLEPEEYYYPRYYY